MQLESEHRRLLNFAVARARAFEQRRMAAEFHAQMEQERQAMQAHFDRTREEIMTEWAEPRRELDETKASTDACTNVATGTA